MLDNSYKQMGMNCCYLRKEGNHIVIGDSYSPDRDNPFEISLPVADFIAMLQDWVQYLKQRFGYIVINEKEGKFWLEGLNGD
ncbi:MAG TPA: hypothetical protein VHA52_11205 [Candidatus Babeliaceae bacterium]|nr:hypothetical protein [Candidatus Babeliaceae bacterium]